MAVTGSELKEITTIEGLTIKLNVDQICYQRVYTQGDESFTVYTMVTGDSFTVRNEG